MTNALRPTRRHLPARPARRGLSLMEVMLSIAILGAALATIGELVRVGALTAANSRDQTKAQLIAETKISEIASGLYPMSAVTQTQYEFDPEWLFSVQITQIDQEGLTAVTVLVEQNAPPAQRPTQYALTRWVREADLMLEEDSTTGDSATGSSSSGAASSSSSSSSGAR